MGVAVGGLGAPVPKLLTNLRQRQPRPDGRRSPVVAQVMHP